MRVRENHSQLGKVLSARGCHECKELGNFLLWPRPIEGLSRSRIKERYKLIPIALRLMKMFQQCDAIADGFKNQVQARIVFSPRGNNNERDSSHNSERGDYFRSTLASLPALPDSLNSLECQHNQLTSLPALPAVLTTLNCEYNNLTSLPELPDSMFQLFIDNNPNLACLPILQTIWDIEFFSDPLLTCVPTYGNVYNSIPPLNSLPICDSTNTTTCTIISSIAKLNTTAALNIFPNPAGDEVNITISGNISGCSMRLCDLSGREIWTAKPESAETQLNTSGLASGL